MAASLRIILVFFAVLWTPLSAQYTINTIAGGGPSDGTPALNVGLFFPQGVARDAVGNLYIASSGANRVFKVDSNGLLSVFAGNGSSAYSGDGGPAAAASLSGPFGVAVDAAGNVYIADSGNSRIRKVTNGVIATVAGGNSSGQPGDGGPATNAYLSAPVGVAVDSGANLYIADQSRIRKVSGGIITTIAGNGSAGFSGDNGPATNATLNLARGVAVDSSGNNVYIADSSNHRIRKVSNGVISTVAGNGSFSFSGENGPATSTAIGFPDSVAVDNGGNLYITDTFNSRIRKVTNGVMTTVASNGYSPQGVIADGAGNFYFSDSNNCIRKVTGGGVITTIAGNSTIAYSGDGGSAISATLGEPSAVAVDNLGNLYIADTLNHVIRKVTNGIITTFAGTGIGSFSGDNGPATSATLSFPLGVSADGSGNVVIADTDNSRIREVSGGVITTVAGNGGAGGAGDNGPATSAEIGYPGGVLLVEGSPPSLYIADRSSRVRRVVSGVINTFSGNGSPGFGGDNGLATNASLASPSDVAFSRGDVYIADRDNGRIRKVSSNVITTVAGGGLSDPGDGGPATSAILFRPSGVAVDSAGNLFVTENNRVREIANGLITTIAGNGTPGFSGDGGPATSASVDFPEGVAVDTFGNVFIADTISNRVRVLTLVPTNLLTLSPISSPVGTASLTLAANGTGFFLGSVIMWNGAPLPTTFVSATKVTATIPGTLLNAASTAIVSVSGSNSVAFRIVPPAVNTLSPSSIGPGAPQFTITVNGSNFINGSVVQFAGTPLSTTFVNSGQLTAIVPANLLTNSATVNVVVINPGASSNNVAFVIGTPALTCAASYPLPPQLRFEGAAELLGNLVLTCTGGTAGQIVNSNISVSANVNLTSRLLSSMTQATEALLVIGNPPPAQQALNTNIFQGSLTSLNTIGFSNVPIPAPGFGSQTVLTIVNLRGNAHQLGQFSAKAPPALNVSIAASGGITISAPQLTAGFPMPTRFLVNGSITSQADQRTIPVSFTEGATGDFKTRVAAGGNQNVLGVAYNTESGFVNTAVLPNAGLADSGTRLRLQFSGVPGGVNVYVPVFPDNPSQGLNAQLVSTDNNGAGPTTFVAGSNMFGGMYAQIPLTGGTGVAVWEVTADNPQAIETLQFHVVLTGMNQPGLGTVVLTGSLAPLSPVTTASGNDPLPRFATDSVTNFVDLTLTSNSVAVSTNGTLALPGRRLPELAVPRAQGDPQVQVGSNLSFVYSLLNNGPGPAPQVTVASNLPSTLLYLGCSTSAGGFCSAGTNPDGSTTVSGMFTDPLPPGRGPYFIVRAKPLSSAIGTSVTVSAILSSGETDAFPDDNTLFTTFGVINSPVTVTVNFASNPSGLKVNPPITVDQGGTITFSAPTPQSDPLGVTGKQYVFSYWSDGSVSANRSGVAPPIGGGTFTASFDTQYQLTLTASPSTRGSVSPSAPTYYSANSLIQLTATPITGSVFTGFTGDVTSTSNPLNLVMPAAPLNIRANFVANALAVSPSVLQFGAVTGGALVTSPQSINVQAPAGVTWTATPNQNFLSVSPASGPGNGSFTVGIVTSALPASGPVSGTVTVSAAGLASVMVNVTAVVGASTKPFGVFDTPVDGMTNIAGAVPVTGWALDSIEVVKVDIWREPVLGEATGPNGLVYIGDAVFSYGARPDVQVANPGLPLNTRGGWGYQMLTNFLPNAAGSGPPGNGIYKLHAIAHNKAGVSVDLGTKTITVDNAHATLPFGTIDTPSQGGITSGSAYVNFGWALTPLPNIIPIDGSTITVVIDGQPVGHPVYNNFRSDVATLFPGYMNSGGAVGFYYVDTTKLSNGVHTISWNVYDNVHNGQGIGSRYFNVFNSGGPVAAPEEEAMEPEIAASTRPIEIEEVGRVELPLGAIGGYQLVDGQRTPLPIGSSLKRGVFYWQPGPGFLGDYTLVFERQDGTATQLRVKIRPKTYTRPTAH